MKEEIFDFQCIRLCDRSSISESRIFGFLKLQNKPPPTALDDKNNILFIYYIKITRLFEKGQNTGEESWQSVFH